MQQLQGHCGVWIKQANADWRCVFSCYSPSQAREYANQCIVHGNNVERIELREPTGECFETIYSHEWMR